MASDNNVVATRNERSEKLRQKRFVVFPFSIASEPRWITSAITEPEQVILHFQSTRKSGFACIALLSGELQLFELFQHDHLR